MSSPQFLESLFSQPKEVGGEFVLKVGEQSFTVQLMRISAKRHAAIVDESIQAGEASKKDMQPTSAVKGMLSSARIVVESVHYEGQPLFTLAHREQLIDMLQFPELMQAVNAAQARTTIQQDTEAQADFS